MVFQVPIESIYIRHADRLRSETYGNIPGLATSIAHVGQLQPILVRLFDPEEFPEVEDEYEYVLVDGGRRYLAIHFAHGSDKIEGIPNLDEGKIQVTIDEEVDPLIALEKEFVANEQREDFSWREKVHYVRRIHEGYSEREDDWGVKDTAAIVDLSDSMVYKYLRLINEEEVWNSPEVKGADTVNVALKQAAIVRDRIKREKAVRAHKKHTKKKKGKREKEAVDVERVKEARKKAEEEAGLEHPELSDDVLELVVNADMRLWLPEQPDDYFQWVHWDPPYGGEQGAGAFGRFKPIADDYKTASELVRFGIPELYRVMKGGAWLALWHHPTYEEEIRFFLQGHERELGSDHCKWCEKEWHPESLANGCAGNPKWMFWVNPYPCIWYKTDRYSDAHEIKRFLTNQYEQFLLACKIDHEVIDPILPRTDRGNVFAYPTPSTEERRHIHHKPASLLKDILSIISIEGELGLDPSFGGGSILEAAANSNRPIKACELDEDYWLAGLFAYQTALDLETVDI